MTATPDASDVEARTSPSVAGYCTFLGVAATLATGQLFGFIPLIPHIAEDLGDRSKLGLPLFAAGYALGMLLIGSLAGRFGARRVLIVCLAAGGVASAATALAPDVGTLLVLRSVEGIVLGGFPPAAFVASAQKVPPARILHANSAMVFGLLGSAGVAGLVSTGLLTVTGWRGAMSVYAVLLLAGSAVAAVQGGIAPGRRSDVHPYRLLVSEIVNGPVALSAAVGAVVMATFVTVNSAVQQGEEAVVGLVLVLVLVLLLIAAASRIVRCPAEIRRLVGFGTTLAGAALLWFVDGGELVALLLVTVGATVTVPASIQLVVAAARRSVPAAVAIFTASLFVGGALAGLSAPGLVRVAAHDALAVIVVSGAVSGAALVVSIRGRAAGSEDGR